MNRIVVSAIQVRTLDAKTDAKTLECTRDGILPDRFYTTGNMETEVLLDGKWTKVGNIRMDCPIVVSGSKASCKKLNDIKAGDQVAVGEEGIRVLEDEKASNGFGFMQSQASSENHAPVQIGQVAREMRALKQAGKRIGVVAGPVVIHAGGRDALASLIRKGYVDSLLSCNALAVHDIEIALYGTSLGKCVQTLDYKSYHHHMWAINEMRKCGSIREAVASGKLRSGIMYECVRRNIPYVLAGSIRDDGPLFDVTTDCIEAQKQMMQQIDGLDCILMLASTLHSIATGNLTPYRVKTICVDINQAVVTKLADRGTAQAIGIVTDVGLFLKELGRHLD